MTARRRPSSDHNGRARAPGLALAPQGLPRRRLCASGLATLFAPALAGAAPPPDAALHGVPVTSERERFVLRTLAAGLEHPWSLAFLPDGRRLVTERPGRLRILDSAGRLDPSPVDGLPAVSAIGQGGLLDVLPHPRFDRNGWIYLAVVSGERGALGTDLVRARLSGRRLLDVQTLFAMQPRSGRGLHFGGRLAFDRDGLLHLSLGDRGDMSRAQRLDDDAGSVIRLHEDGRIPADNPFVSRPGTRPGKFTLGHRNIQGLALNPASGALWMHEHGPQGGDELNVLRSGRNYGWPVITHGVNYGLGTRIGEGTARADIEPPLHQWTPSIAPSGLAFGAGSAYPGWQTSVFIGALRGEALHRLELDGERVVREERLLHRAVGRVRDVRLGPDRLLYLLTDAPEGRLLRLEPAPGASAG